MSTPDRPFGITAPSATSSDEEKRLYDLQMAILDTQAFWPPDQWQDMMQHLVNYVRAVRAATQAEAYVTGWDEAMRKVACFAEEEAHS